MLYYNYPIVILTDNLLIEKFKYHILTVMDIAIVL